MNENIIRPPIKHGLSIDVVFYQNKLETPDVVMFFFETYAYPCSHHEM